MSEYISKDYFLTFFDKVNNHPTISKLGKEYAEIFKMSIDQAPEQCVLDIVRCKDCIHYGLNRLEEEYGCHNWTDWHFVYSYDFCSDGVRKKK